MKKWSKQTAGPRSFQVVSKVSIECTAITASIIQRHGTRMIVQEIGSLSCTAGLGWIPSSPYSPVSSKG